MKLARYIPAGIGTRICALALTGSAVTGGVVIGGAVIGGATPAGAVTLAPHVAAQPATGRTAIGQTAAEATAAWVNGPGWRYLNATEAAEASRNGAALTRAATLAAEHPQPADKAEYVTMMHWYATAGRALTSGDAATAREDLAVADEMAWNVIEATFGALDRVSLNG
jgi:hypothetical protein